MKLNERTVIYGTRVILVPYEREHVAKYHEWMKDPFILQRWAPKESKFKLILTDKI